MERSDLSSSEESLAQNQPRCPQDLHLSGAAAIPINHQMNCAAGAQHDSSYVEVSPILTVASGLPPQELVTFVTSSHDNCQLTVINIPKDNVSHTFGSCNVHYTSNLSATRSHPVVNMSSNSALLSQSQIVNNDITPPISHGSQLSPLQPYSRAKTVTVNAVSACLPRPVHPATSSLCTSRSPICSVTTAPPCLLHTSLPIYSSLPSSHPVSAEDISGDRLGNNNSISHLNGKSDTCSNASVDNVNASPDDKALIATLTNELSNNCHLNIKTNSEKLFTSSCTNSYHNNVGSVNAEVLSNDADQDILATNNGGQILNNGPLYNWQASMSTVKERFAFLFNNEILSDVHFIVGKGEGCQRIPAHKFVLAVGSAVFDAMFNGSLSTHQKEIELPDVEPQAFLALLKFLYSDEVQIGPETVMTVLYTAKKYAVPALEHHCVDFLKSNLSPDNAFMLLSQARLFDEPQLAALCLETIDKNTAEALDAEGFCDIDKNTLCQVLERDTLRIREAKLFQAVVRWSETECEREGTASSIAQKRKVLGRALSLIRFPLMTVEEFALGPAQCGILTDREVVQLFLYFTVNPKPTVNFLDIPRCCMTGKEQSVCRFQQIESRWGYSGTSDRIRFIVDKRIFVVGFGMYGSIHGPSEYEVTIQILHTGTGKVCASNDTGFTTDGTVNTFRVMFKEPVEIFPNTNYTAYATLKGPDSHYGTKGVRKVSVECPSGDRVTFHFTYAAGNNNGTSVEDGQIPEIIFYT